MRLFFAINFQNEVKNRLAALQNDLRKQSLSGNFTLYDNLHLTVVFIGEVSDSEADRLLQLVKEIKPEPFMLRIDHLGHFKRGSGDIIWAGIEKSAPLLSLYDELASKLRSAGFRIEARPYTPHLTLARGVRLRGGFSLKSYSDAMNAIDAPITELSLMKSERINGRLTYTKLNQHGE